MKRLFDLTIVILLAPIVLFVALVIGAVVKMTCPGPVLYWSQRVGRKNRLFAMPKFRTMKVGAPVVATHLLDDPQAHITSVGKWLRTSSLDEIPQLWCVLTGEMSLVGPRPALFNQYDLIEKRTAQGVDEVLPGITGWAQINGRDELSIDDKVTLDWQYVKCQSLGFDLKILFLTVFRVLKRQGVAH